MKKADALAWHKYSEENLRAAKLMLQNELYNPCLQNIQQSVEKILKAAVIEFSLEFKKTHNIGELRSLLVNHGKNIDLTEDDSDFLDSIYLTSKYPLASVLPHFEPGENICRKGLAIAERIIDSIKQISD